MEGRRDVKRKAEASPERPNNVTTTKLIKTTEIDSMEDVAAAGAAPGALSCDIPKLDDGAGTNAKSQPFKTEVLDDNKVGNESEEESEECNEIGEDWGDESERDDDCDEYQDDSMDMADNYDGISGDEDDNMGPTETKIEEHKHYLGGSEVNFKLFVQDDDDAFDAWMHTIHVHCSSDGKEIGRAFGRFVKRDRIKSNFWRHMEEPCHELSSIAFGLFDRYGRLRREFIDHATRKGSGCWGEEVDFGALFIIEYVQVDSSWRRKGVGKKMVESLIAKASAEKKIAEPSGNSSDEDDMVELLFNETNAKANKLAFTLVSPGWLNEDISQELVGKTAREQRDIKLAAEDVSVAFYRTIGFRRIGASSCFGLAVDPNHRAYKISIHNDFDPHEEEVDDEDLEARQMPFRREAEHSLLMELLEKRLPLHHAALTLPDIECANHYEEINKLPTAEEQWKKSDTKLNNLLHIASCESKPKTVEWLINNVDMGQTLSSARNIKGYTPLEALQAILEGKRTTTDNGWSKVCIMDTFAGFSVESVNCVAVLRGIKTPSRIQLLRFMFGCPCEQCIDGYFSPRMKEALLRQSALDYDTLSQHIEDRPFWVQFNRHLIHHVRPDIQRNFETNVSLRKGFTNIFKHAATAMRKGYAPTAQNVFDVLDASNEWFPVTKSYFQREGAPVDALRVMFERSRDDDPWAGDGMLRSILGGEQEESAEIAALPRCRNDLEFGMAALLCGMPDL
ncbi:hypothetical protein V492_06129 [Pseudogymnoascus sp. VKM F-4246]|nr:hypothetical protein V492_06129 [Pseudogymnoascus sp. VKM F-4246]